jgi:hypothetical protein
MITLKQYLEAIDYRITEGTDYTWNCYGPHAAYLDGYVDERWSASVIFDRKTQTVYEAQICDYRKDRCYRLFNPEWRAAHDDEARAKNVDPSIAWDDLRWVDLETDEDFLEKTTAIVANRDYDTRVSVPVDLPDSDLFLLMKQAHEQDITLNHLIESILRAEVDRHTN